MYKLLKGRGAGANVTIVNTDTLASVIIGMPSIQIIEILNSYGYSPTATESGKVIELADEWNIEIPNACATELSKLALRMKKPVRHKEDKSEQEVKPETHDKKQPVDVFNLIFGVKD